MSGTDDLRDVGHAFGEGSFDEAVFGWVIPDAQARRERVDSGVEIFAGWLGGILETGDPGRRRRNPSVAGVPVWERVTGPPEISGEAAARAEAFLVQLRCPRTTDGARVRVDGRTPFLRRTASVLQSIVVVPEAEGRGLGGAMLRGRLAEADAEGLPVYLVASTPRNRERYLRHGFVAGGTPIRLPDEGPVLRPMWRSPASR